MSLKLWTYTPGNPRAYKALIAAQFNGVKVEVCPVQMGTTNKTPEFLKMNPQGKVPTLQTPEGAVWESNAIARHVARLGQGLYGKNVFESGLVDQWIDFSSTTIDPITAAWVYPIFGYAQFDQKVTEQAKTNAKNVLKILDDHLSTRTYLVGERVSLADIVVSMSLYLLYTQVMAPEFRASFVNVNRWFTTLVNKKEYVAVAGKTELAAVMKEWKPVEKKEEKKVDTAALAAAAEEEEKPKGKNPLDTLPPSKLNLEEWKRFYSNNDTRSAAIPWFWEHYDPEGYCVYFGEYKYNDENTALFKTCNAVGGFFQRLEKLHKYAFGSALIVGTNEAHDITLCFVFRGTEIPAEMKECDDFVLYEWTRANTDDAATKELINDYFAWDKDIRGKPVLQGKTYK